MISPRFRQAAAVHLLVIPFTLAILFPFAVMMTSALKSNSEIFVAADEFRWLPLHPHWENFILLRQKVPLIGAYFLNSALIATGATLLAIVASMPAAYALARLRFPGRKMFLQMVLVTQMFSPIVVIVGLYKQFAGTSVEWLYTLASAVGLGFLANAPHPATLIDNLFGLILVNAAFNLAFAIWLLSGYFATVPREVEEAAMVDGCSWWRTIIHVLIPLAAPGIVTAAIFVFIAAWNEFIFALTLLSSPEKKPIIVGLVSLVGAFEVQWNFIMAGALLAVAPVVVLFWLAEKHLVSGLTSGAIK